MKYGVHLPNFGSYGDTRVLADLAVTAEKAGWDGFFIWDHMLFCDLDKNAHVDPWVALTAVAMTTSRIQFGTIVTAMPRRRPWKLARETVSLHNLSGGRLILGVGLGDPVEWEYRFFHEADDPKIRAQKVDEGLAILQGLWSGEAFGFKGTHYHLEEMTFLPKPVTSIPVWIGGYWPRKAPMRRAARYNGVVPGLTDRAMTAEALQQVMDYIRQQRTATTPYDVVIGGITEPESDAYEKTVKPFVDVGATWWLEDLSPLRLEDFGWEDLWKEWDVEIFRARIEAGPPRE
jgi:alkanesulfonate monooxygenase SsuD/methylene tetrahydromethanopterin reductase-like flavin-dependent oxidoreductase (luciferase family)